MATKKKKWIQGAIKHPGALHRDLGVPMGKKIPEKKLKAAEKKGGKVGERAHLAETLKGMHHGSKHAMPPASHKTGHHVARDGRHMGAHMPHSAITAQHGTHHV